MQHGGEASLVPSLLVAMIFSRMICEVSGFVHMPVSQWQGGTQRQGSWVSRPQGGICVWRLPGLVIRGREKKRGVHRRLQTEVSMAAVFRAELAFQALDVQEEFFVAKTLGGIALPGSVFHCTTDPSKPGGEGTLSHFKFDFEYSGSVAEARGFLDKKFSPAKGSDHPESVVVLPEMILVNPALLTYCAELTFKALSDHEEAYIASQLGSFALPNRTYVSFEAPEAPDGPSATFQFQFELGGTLEDAGEVVKVKFPSSVDRFSTE